MTLRHGSRAARLGATARFGSSAGPGVTARPGDRRPGATAPGPDSEGAGAVVPPPVRGRVHWRRGRGSGPERARPPVVDGVVEIASSLRAGLPPAAAWSSCGVRVVDGLPREVDLVQRLDAAPHQVRAVVAAARCALELGAAQARVLDRVAASLAAEVEADASRRAALAGPAATARLLLWLPLVGLALGAALGARPWEVLLDGGAGSALGAVGALLAVAGYRWSRRLLRTAERAGAEP